MHYPVTALSKCLLDIARLTGILYEAASLVAQRHSPRSALPAQMAAQFALRRGAPAARPALGARGQARACRPRTAVLLRSAAPTQVTVSPITELALDDGELDFRKVIASSGNTLVVVDFFTDWYVHSPCSRRRRALGEIVHPFPLPVPVGAAPAR